MSLPIGSSAWACREGMLNNKGVAVSSWAVGVCLFFKCKENEWYYIREGFALPHSGPHDGLLDGGDCWEIREIPPIVAPSIRDKPMWDLTFWEHAVQAIYIQKLTVCKNPSMLHAMSEADELVAQFDAAIEALKKEKADK